MHIFPVITRKQIGVVVHKVKQKPMLLASYFGLLFTVLSALLPTQFPTNAPGQAVKDDPGFGALNTYVGDPDGGLGSYLGLS